MATDCFPHCVQVQRSSSNDLGGETVAKHGPAAPGIRLANFVLDHVPVLGKQGILISCSELMYVAATVPTGCRATFEYSRRYPRRRSGKDRQIHSRCAALPIRCPASGRDATEAAAQC